MQGIVGKLVLACMLAAPDAPKGGAAEDYWPMWRGPLATGVAPHANPPVTWSETKNVRWKTALPGLGQMRLMALTGRDGEAYCWMSGRAGFAFHIAKPAEPAAIEAALAVLAGELKA